MGTRGLVRAISRAATGGTATRHTHLGWRGAIRLQDLTAEHHLGRHAGSVAGGRRHRGLRIRLDLRPLLPDLLRPERPVPGGLDDADRPGAGHHPASAGHPGHRHPLPPPGRAGQHGCRTGHHLRRPAGTGHRCGLERGGVRRLRHRIGHSHRAIRPFRGSLPGPHRVTEPRDHRLFRFSGPVLSAEGRAQRTQGPAAAAPADLHRRQRREAHAAHHRQVRRPLELRRRHPGRVRPQARCAQSALRRRGPRSEGHHAVRTHPGR